MKRTSAKTSKPERAIASVSASARATPTRATATRATDSASARATATRATATVTAGATAAGIGRARYTFHGNVRDTRYGWLRLTPAYSVHLVRELLDARRRPDLPVLDPFCGTGTTLLTCAERGIDCTTLDVNPFLVWLAGAKTADYSQSSLLAAAALMTEMRRAAGARGPAPWLPALHQIEKWWAAPTLHALGRAFDVLQHSDGDRAAQDLCKLAFCRSLITCANVSFRHQSMSFFKTDDAKAPTARRVAAALGEAFAPIANAAANALPATERHVVSGDSRQVAKHLQKHLEKAKFGAVITSPPYVNRMSYVRELRPYMYWLGYLEQPSDAGELDWQAIGGTWGLATSRLSRWQGKGKPPLAALPQITAEIAEQSEVLARYVAKYFFDMAEHVKSLSKLVARGGEVHYVVGNSKFFDVMVPAERLFASLFEQNGFETAKITTLRKRTSKHELFEFLVSATKR